MQAWQTARDVCRPQHIVEKQCAVQHRGWRCPVDAAVNAVALHVQHRSFLSPVQQPVPCPCCACIRAAAGIDIAWQFRAVWPSQPMPQACQCHPDFRPCTCTPPCTIVPSTRHRTPMLATMATTTSHALLQYLKQQCNKYGAASGAAVAVLLVVVGCLFNSTKQSQRQCPGVKSALPALNPPAPLGSSLSRLWITQEPTCTTSNGSHRRRPRAPCVAKTSTQGLGLRPKPQTP